MKILLVEDDKGLSEVLSQALQEQRYQVDLAQDGLTGWELAETYEYDLILLDWKLPKLDGISLCKRLRFPIETATPVNRSTPILLLTTKSDSTDKIVGLDAGADDYLVKPIEVNELLARIRALLRRTNPTRSPILEWENLIVDLNNCTVSCFGETVSLSPKEYELLILFLRNPKRIFSQNTLIEQLWSLEETPTDSTIRTHVKKLRQKLIKSGIGDIIETVYGMGYRLRPSRLSLQEQTENSPDQELEKPKVTQELLTASQSQSSNQIISQFQGLWLKHWQSYSNRISVLESTAQSIETSVDTEHLLKAAQDEAHVLAGSLGSFGLERSSQLAKNIEQLLINWKPKNLSQLQQWLLELRFEFFQVSANCYGKIQSSSRQTLPESSRKVQVKETFPEEFLSKNRLFIIAEDAILIKKMTSEIPSWGLLPDLITDISQLEEKASLEGSHAIFVELSTPIEEDKKLKFLIEMQVKYPAIPIIVLTNQRVFSDQIKLTRLGIKKLLQRPVSTFQIMASVFQVLHQPVRQAKKVLVIHQEPQTIVAIEEALHPLNLQITSLAEPCRFWDMLEQFTPDLLILSADSELAEQFELTEQAGDSTDATTDSLSFNGFDLCRIVRSDPFWSNLPILFITSQINSATVPDLIEVGADDFLMQSVIGTELALRVSSRLERSQAHRNEIGIDDRTGLNTRHRFVQELPRLLQLVDRHAQPLSFVLLEITQFQQLGNLYGQEAEDQVLSYLGKLLQHAFRSEDVLGHWAPGKFSLGLFGMTKVDGKRRLIELLNVVQKELFQGCNHQTFQIQLYAGIAQYPEDGSTLQALYWMAELALDQARMGGDNQIALC